MNRVPLRRLRALLRLDPETGLLYWRQDRGNTVKAGCVAGSVNARRYVRLEVDGVRLSAHRVVWALHHGKWPPNNMQVDHVNGVKKDNRPANLRLADNSQNQMSAGSRPGKSGLRGVAWSAQMKKWRAKIMKDKKNIHLGYFDCEHEAHRVYCDAAKDLHGHFHNPRTQPVR